MAHQIVSVAQPTLSLTVLLIYKAKIIMMIKHLVVAINVKKIQYSTVFFCYVIVFPTVMF